MKGKTVLITGAGRGIGRATALRFARGGAQTVLVGRTAEALEETARQITAAGGAAFCVPADVSREADVQRAVRETLRRFGRIDVLVNNAGVAPLSPLAQMTTASFDELLAVNVRGVFLMCREVWPAMASAGGGVIINVSSRAARDPFPGFAAYGGTKAFVETFTTALAAEGAARGIRAFGVAPGAVATRMLLDLFPNYPRDKLLDPDEVAGLIEWLCDPRCAASSGQTLGLARDG
jgi:NAD(P)-dependent dehydrogenase (short-subunit alcohol dehydrogenase family)